jgi:hypothetical protein
MHVDGLERHFKGASDFLVRCQIVEPFVQKGILRGCVCPWEIGTADTSGFTILEDFHDTLEAIWVWCYYTEVSKKNTYRSNIEMAWNYVTANFDRHIPPAMENEGLYDCSHVVLSGSLYERIFSDDSYRRYIETAGNRLTRYLLKIASSTKGYSDSWMKSCFTWWMAFCLASAAQSLGNNQWLEAARTFVNRTIIEKRKPLSIVDSEPRARGGPGDHECFSCNANKVLALLSCYSSERVAKEMIVHTFLPLAPKRFVKRCVDENAWNANVAMALGKSYSSNGESGFLERYFSIMDELKKRDVHNSSALPRSEGFPVRESWVTFFYAYAYASVITRTPCALV